jgi:hypothetical protein
MKFEILGEIRDLETIATGRGVYIRRYLERAYGKGRWRKMIGADAKPAPLNRKAFGGYLLSECLTLSARRDMLRCDQVL